MTPAPAGTMSLQAGLSSALVESPPRPGPPTPDHERPPWHVTGVTPAGQCTRDTRIPPVRSSLADKRHIGARMGRLTARSRTPAARKLPGAPGKRPDSQEINGTMHEGQNMPGTLCA